MCGTRSSPNTGSGRSRCRTLVGESHHYADICFGYGATIAPPPAFVSTVKIKQAGFCEVYDTELSFRYWLRTLIERKVLPPSR